MAEDCGRGERLGWQEFVRDYAPITRVLLEQYFPMLKPELDMHVTAVFERARADNNAWFSAFRFDNEREFLMYFRELVFAYGRSVARVPVPEISLDQMREIMKDQPGRRAGNAVALREGIQRRTDRPHDLQPGEHRQGDSRIGRAAAGGNSPRRVSRSL